MATHFLEATSTDFEARITGGSVTELATTVRRMAEECVRWHGTSESLTWRAEEGEIIVSFPGSSAALGWEPDSSTDREGD